MPTKNCVDHFGQAPVWLRERLRHQRPLKRFRLGLRSTADHSPTQCSECLRCRFVEPAWLVGPSDPALGVCEPDQQREGEPRHEGKGANQSGASPVERVP